MTTTTTTTTTNSDNDNDNDNKRHMKYLELHNYIITSYCYCYLLSLSFLLSINLLSMVFFMGRDHGSFEQRLDCSCCKSSDWFQILLCIQRGIIGFISFFCCLFPPMTCLPITMSVIQCTNRANDAPTKHTFFSVY